MKYSLRRAARIIENRVGKFNRRFMEPITHLTKNPLEHGSTGVFSPFTKEKP